MRERKAGDTKEGVGCGRAPWPMFPVPWKTVGRGRNKALEAAVRNKEVIWPTSKPGMQRR